MTVLQSKKVRIGELDVRYYTGGSGEPLLVIHGGANGAGAWKQNAAELCKNYTVYVPELPGFGNSQPLEGVYYIPELVDFVDRFSDSMGLSTFHLMGHSLGGAVALNYVLTFPHKITKLVLISSMGLGKDIALWVRVLSRSRLTRCMGTATVHTFKAVKWVAEKLFAGIDFVVPVSRTSMLIGCSMTTLKEQTTVLIHRLSEIMVPTLVVWGANDPIVPAYQAYAAGRLIPLCRVEVFAGCGHSVYRQRIPEFSSILTGFLG